MQGKIEITPKLMEMMCSEFHCTNQTVYNALKYETNGPLAKLIRARALTEGGALLARMDYVITVNTNVRFSLWQVQGCQRVAEGELIEMMQKVPGGNCILYNGLNLEIV